MSGPPKDYVEVSERIQEFRDTYPDGTLQSDIHPSPTDGFIVVKAYAYRTPDDQRPGTGLAWEPVPGKTNFTRDSELMNAETSAWGRALIAVGAADAKRGIASANEVRNRQQTNGASKPARKPDTSPKQLVVQKLKDEGIPSKRFVDFLGSQYGVERFDELAEEDRTQVVYGLTQGDLVSKLREGASA